MKKLIGSVETMLGIDIDGDGKIGNKPKPGTGYPPGYPPQQQYAAYPQPQPYNVGGPHPAPYPPQQAAGGYGAAPAPYPQQQQPQPHGGYGQPYAQQQPQMVAPAPAAAGGGNKKALLIGINYYGQRGELSGCVNDVKIMQQLLRNSGFADGSYQEVVLCDDPRFPGGAKMPTKREILTAFRWLASNNQPGDTLFFHYSGHGGQVRDRDGDEADGYDETIIPVDFKQAGQITDDVIFQDLVAPLPAGVRLTAIMDCCHSGTAMDLPYVFRANESSMQQALANPAQLAMVVLNKKKLAGLLGAMLGGKGGGRPSGPAGFTQDGKKHCAADVVMFSGCSDSQTSADVQNISKFGLPPGTGPGGAGGACTAAFNSVMIRHHGTPLPFVQLLEKMRIELRNRNFKQVPQLSASRPINLATPFSYYGPLQAAQVAPIHAAPGNYGRPPAQGLPYGYQPVAQAQAPYPPPQYQQYGQYPPAQGGGYSAPAGGGYGGGAAYGGYPQQQQPQQQQYSGGGV